MSALEMTIDAIIAEWYAEWRRLYQGSISFAEYIEQRGGGDRIGRIAVARLEHWGIQ